MPERSQRGNRISTWWISRFAGRMHRDTQSGFRVYPRSMFGGRPLRSSRFATETELLLRAAKHGVALVEVPIATIYNTGSVTHFRDVSDTLRIIFLVLGSLFWRDEPGGGGRRNDSPTVTPHAG